MKNIFITGASGFIGSNLARELAGRGCRVRALTRQPPPESLSDRGIEFVRGDISRGSLLREAVDRVDTVFHCAALISFRKRDFPQAFRVNVEGTGNVLETAYRGGVEKVVHLSACAVLGFSSNPNLLIDETADPVIEKNNIYAYTKKLAEKEVQKYVKKGLDVSIANIATVYGHGDRKLNSGSIIKAIYEGRMKFVPPGGTSFVSVDDLIEGLLSLGKGGRSGERYIFCAENLKYTDLVRRIAKILGVQPPRHLLPRWAFYPALAAVKSLEMLPKGKSGKLNLINSQILRETYGYKYFSSTKARAELGWKPRQSFEAAVKQAVDYYRTNRLLGDLRL